MLRRFATLSAPKPRVDLFNKTNASVKAGFQNQYLADRSARGGGKIATFVNAVESRTEAVFDKKSKLYAFYSYIKGNFGGLASYQLIMEGLFTAYFFAGLQSGQFTTAGLHDLFISKLSIPDYLFGFGDAHYTEDYEIPYLGKSVNKSTMTNVHTAHNVAMFFIPLQVLIVLGSYPLVQKQWASRVYPFITNHVPFVSSLIKKPTMPREFADNIMWATAQKRKAEEARQAASAKISPKNKGFRQ